ncbi:hypothetical protein MNBD_GAMMA13-236 [hydrothermal vent metagenome]|uniref:Cytochrome P460 domain-containing protein n=1 Tax=hydrothermal vent metagenome TaxID=652676 RepID=A0A3B0YQR3_9ZZZZ
MKQTRKGWYKIAFTSLTLLSAVTLYGCQTTARTMGMGPPMGSSGDIADSQALWSALKKADLVGPQAEKSKPYMGSPPHGKVLETLHRKITVDGHTGLAIVKRNYGGPGVSLSSVNTDRAKYLKAVTVMYKRKAGYDTEDKDWFWAKYKPDGSLHVKEAMGMEIQLAGRVAKGKPEGCISCHQGAPDGDFIFAGDIQSH